MHPLTASTLCYLLGYLTGACAFAAMAIRRRLLTSGMLRLMCAGVIGGLLCAVIAQWLIAGDEGKSVLGGLAGGYLTVFLYKRRLGIKRSTGDLFAVALSAGEAVGRWGCYFAGCCYGRPSTAAWTIYQHGAYRYPTQIYSSIAAAIILAALLLVERRRPPENTLFFLQGVLYCVARFIIEFYRAGPITPIGLTAAQLACLAGIVFFGVGLVRLVRSTASVDPIRAPA